MGLESQLFFFVVFFFFVVVVVLLFVCFFFFFCFVFFFCFWFFLFCFVFLVFFLFLNINDNSNYVKKIIWLKLCEKNKFVLDKKKCVCLKSLQCQKCSGFSNSFLKP